MLAHFLAPLTMKYCVVTGAGTNGNPYYAIELGFNYATVVADIENCSISGNLNGGIWAVNASLGTIIRYNTLGNNGTGGAGVGPYDIDRSGNSNISTSICSLIL